MSGTIELSKAQIAYVVEKTGIESPKDAVVYFAELMTLEKISLRKMSLVITKMMAKEGKKR